MNAREVLTKHANEWIESNPEGFAAWYAGHLVQTEKLVECLRLTGAARCGYTAGEREKIREKIEEAAIVEINKT